MKQAADERAFGARGSRVPDVATDVWDLYGELSEADPESLSEMQRRTVAISDLRQEVNAGGFDNYLRAWGGNSASVAVAALPEVLGREWADLLNEALRVVGSPYPDDPDERAAKLDADPASDEALAALDERFYDLEASRDADARLNEFIRTNGL
jgi:hypothetical protein